MPIDCEALHDGLIGQPINAITALGFLLGAFLVFGRSKPLAVALAVLAAGSFSFHSDQNLWFGWLDSFGVVLVLGALIEQRLGHPRSLPLLAGGASIGALVVIPQVLRGPVSLLVGLAAVAAVVRTTPTKWVVVSATVGVVGIAIYLLGRNDGPLCEPDSWLQPHAVWHLLATAAIVIVGLAPQRST